jgi:Ca2+-transporting ATPase
LEDAAIEPADPERGLSDAEALRRLSEHGPNELVPERRESFLVKLAKPFVEPMALLLLGVGAIYLALGERRDGLVMFAAVFPIALMDHVLELRMERTLSALRRLVRPQARVVREGSVRSVPSRELVPGDLLVLEEGDVIAADARVTKGSDLLADESSLTGESVPVPKETGDTVFAGSTLVVGYGRAAVERTGAHTEYGKIGALVATIETPRTPLQVKLRRLVIWLTAGAVATCAAVVALGVARGLGWMPALLSGASLALAAAPEEFPLVFTLFLTLGVFRLAKHRALIRRWSGVEALGAITVIACDKTGTLTEGKLHLALAWTPRGEAPVGPSMTGEAVELLRLAVLASEPEPYDPLERALHDGCRAARLDPAAWLERRELAKEHAFVRERLRMSHIWRDGESKFLLALKGALEGVLPACALEPAEREAIAKTHDDLARRGMKVLAVATRGLDSLDGGRDDDESHLRFEGLVAFVDPPRAGVPEALARCRAAGIHVLMITGDHPATAVAVGRELGFGSETNALVGDEISRLSDDDLARALATSSVVARATPQEKHRIVRALRRSGEVVAMTGDGVNDAAALKEADVGIAMGERGTDVARAAATMVLLDDAFPTIVVAIEEGRRIYDNIKKSFRYLIPFHVPIFVAALVVPLLRWPLLLLPVHFVWLELVAHPLAALAFEGEPPERGLMARPPRRPDEGLVQLGEALRATALGLTVTAASLGLYGWSILVLGATSDHARGSALALLVTAQVGLVLTERTAAFAFAPGFLSRNGKLSLACFGVLGSAALVFGIPDLRILLHLEAPRLDEWLTVLALASAATLWPEALKLLRVWHSGTGTGTRAAGLTSLSLDANVTPPPGFRDPERGGVPEREPPRRSG